MAFLRTPYFRPYLVGEASVTLNGSGTGSTAVLFTPDAFVAAPQVMVVKPNGDTGTVVASLEATTGFTVTVTTSTRINQVVKISWYAAEKI